MPRGGPCVGRTTLRVLLSTWLSQGHTPPRSRRVSFLGATRPPESRRLVSKIQNGISQESDALVGDVSFVVVSQLRDVPVPRFKHDGSFERTRASVPRRSKKTLHRLGRDTPVYTPTLKSPRKEDGGSARAAVARTYAFFPRRFFLKFRWFEDTRVRKGRMRPRVTHEARSARLARSHDTLTQVLCRPRNCRGLARARARGGTSSFEGRQRVVSPKSDDVEIGAGGRSRRSRWWAIRSGRSARPTWARRVRLVSQPRPSPSHSRAPGKRPPLLFKPTRDTFVVVVD